MGFLKMYLMYIPYWKWGCFIGNVSLLEGNLTIFAFFFQPKSLTLPILIFWVSARLQTAFSASVFGRSFSDKQGRWTKTSFGVWGSHTENWAISSHRNKNNRNSLRDTSFLPKGKKRDFSFENGRFWGSILISVMGIWGYPPQKYLALLRDY